MRKQGWSGDPCEDSALYVHVNKATDNRRCLPSEICCEDGLRRVYATHEAVVARPPVCARSLFVNFGNGLFDGLSNVWGKRSIPIHAFYFQRLDRLLAQTPSSDQEPGMTDWLA